MEEILSGLNQPTEIRDANGRLLGYFAPATDEEMILYWQAMRHFDPQELHRRKASGERGATTQEVMDRLQSLEEPGCGSP